MVQKFDFQLFSLYMVGWLCLLCICGICCELMLRCWYYLKTENDIQKLPSYNSVIRLDNIELPEYKNII
jgi:hypothetical protein